MKMKRSFRYLVSLLLMVSLLLSAGCGSGVVSDGQGHAESQMVSQGAADGVYSCEVTLSGGSGRASVESPAEVTVKDGQAKVKLVWSSPYYDYMVVDGQKYENETKAGENSTFTVPVAAFDQEQDIIADTTRMSEAHEIEYTICVKTPGETEESSRETDSESAAESAEQALTAPDTLGNLKHTGSLTLDYATQFTVDWYEAETSETASQTETAGSQDSRCALIIIGGTDEYLLVPDGAQVPEGLDENITLLRGTPDKTYMVSTSALDFVQAIGALDDIAWSSLKESSCYVEEARQAMKDGKISYAGKYSAPDFELLLSGGCNLAIENTMIYHNPAVMEKLQTLGIPVLVEKSSYESSPLGRLEWVKLYGVLYGALDKAQEFFDGEVESIQPLLNEEETGKKVAFFSVNSAGLITVRRPGDYITKIIDMAGGSYVFGEESDTSGSATSTMNMQMEDFYSGAKDADVLIYNSTISGEIDSIADLTAKNSVFSDFTAVKSGEVYCLEPGFFQKSTQTAALITDIYKVLHGDEDGLKFLKKLS